MKQPNKLLLLFALLLSMWQLQAQTPTSPPTVYKNVGSGTKTIQDTIGSHERWLKWIGDSVVSVQFKVLQKGSTYTLDSVELYLSSGSSFTLRSRDSIKPIDSTAFLYTGIIPSGSTLYIRMLTTASTCTSCAAAAPIVNIRLYTNYGTCSPVTPCDLVNNGGFESVNSANACNYYINGVVNCWNQYEGTTDVYTRYCTNNNNVDDLGASTWSTPPFDSHNGHPNDVVVGCYVFYEPAFNYHYSESIQSLLNTPLVNGQTYKVSFWAFNFKGNFNNHTINNGGNPVKVSVAASNGTSIPPGGSYCDFPVNVHDLTDFSVFPVNTWTLCTNTFVYNGPNENNIMIGTNIGQNVASGYVGDSDPFQYVLFDDVSLTRIYTPTITVSPRTQTVCAGAHVPITATSTPSIASSSYTWMPGAMTGSNVSVSPIVSTVYTVTGTDACGMTASATVAITVNPLPVVSASASPTLICPGGTSTLTSSGLNLGYNWQPGSLSGNTVTVSPTTSTIYTVTGTNNSTGCTATATTQVMTFTVGFSGGPNPICVGNSATLSASSSDPNPTSYTWQPTGITSATAIVSPSVTTVYTVTASDNNGCTMNGTYTQTVNSFSSLYANPSGICAGGTATLYASGGTSYTWQPGALTGSAVAVSPSVTTTYTLYGNIPGCGVGHSAVTVYVINSAGISPTITISSPYVCAGKSTTLTVSTSTPSLYSYTWQPGNLNGQSITVSPTDNTIYTCNVSDLIGCNASASASMCVDVTATVCCTSSEVIPYNTTINSGSAYQNLTSGPYAISGVLTVSVNTTWSNCSFRMSSGAKILVSPTARLNVTNCSFYSCQDMWQGIELAHNGSASGQLTLSGCSVEDAYKAVYNNCLNTTVGGILTVSGTTFNKNYIGVNIVNSKAAVGTYSCHPFTSDNSVYTSTASITSPGNSLKCSSFYSPIIKSRGRSGVELNAVYLGVVGPGTVTSTPDNSFSYMDYGVFVQESSFESLSNQYSNFTGVGVTGFPAPPTIGVGIYGVTTNTNTTLKIGANNTNFTNVYRAVETQKIPDVRVNTYTVNNTAISTASTCGSGCIGNTGIYANDPIATFEANMGTITNCNTGIYANYSSIPSYTSNPTQTSASNNTITTTGSYLATQAIILYSSGNNFTSVPDDMVVVNANTISKCVNGIAMTNIKNGGRMSSNNITMPYATSGSYTGINLNGTNNATVDNNTISSTGTANNRHRAVYMQLSPSCKLNCNTVNTVGQCFVYEGNCLTTAAGWYNNTMNTANDGLVLRLNGVIGIQGNTGLSSRYSGNQWLGTFSNSKTLVNDAGSSAQNSNLVVQNNTNEYPQPQSLNIVQSGGSAILGVDNYGVYPNVNPGTISLSSIFASPYTCTSPMTSGLKVAHADSTLLAEEKAQKDSALYRLVSQLDTDAVYLPQTRDMNRRYVYGLMDRGYATSHTGLNAFYTANHNTVLESNSNVDSLILAQAYTSAQSANTAVGNSTSLVDQNQHLVNAALLNALQNPGYVYTSSEISDLAGLAYKCPLKHGNAVYQARALLCRIYNDNILFGETCTEADLLARKSTHTKTGVAVTDVTLYPNPNNGSMSLQYQLNRAADLRIYDISGQLLYSEELSPESHLRQLQLNLGNGVYYYSLSAKDGQLLKSDKIIIIK